MRKLKGAAGLLSATLAIVGSALLFPVGARASYVFQNVINTGDVNFNQELAINSSGEIAGYFGDGTILPNKGYTVVPPYGSANFTNENFPGSVQTQVTGINNAGDTVGFWIDGAGANHGFTDFGGTFTSHDSPDTTAVPPFTQFLGVNNSREVAGFDNLANGDSQAFTFLGGTFTFLTVPNSTSAAATSVNNSGEVSGFETSSINGDTYGFLDMSGTFQELLFPGSTFTQFLGLTNNGLVVGVYQDAAGNNHGLVYNSNLMTWQTVDDPSAVTGMGNGTTINGINDAGQLVGFYVNAGGQTIGLVANSTPEPASYAFGAGALALIAFGRRRRTAAV
jgi:MYXO-CTERM domain-containing protein